MVINLRAHTSHVPKDYSNVLKVALDPEAVIPVFTNSSYWDIYILEKGCSQLTFLTGLLYC